MIIGEVESEPWYYDCTWFQNKVSVSLTNTGFLNLRTFVRHVSAHTYFSVEAARADLFKKPYEDRDKIPRISIEASKLPAVIEMLQKAEKLKSMI